MAFFLLCLTEREREKGGRKSTKLLSMIYGASLVYFRRAKDKSSSHRRGVRVSTKKEAFRRRSNIGDSGEIKVVGLRRLPTHSSTLQEVGILHTLVLVSIVLLVFRVRMVECVKGLFGQKNAQNSTIFA